MGSWIRGIATTLMALGIAGVLAGAFLVVGAVSGAFGHDEVAVLSVFGVLMLATGGLRVWAGLRNRQYRSRTLGVVALSLGVLDPLSWSCGIVFLTLIVLGLVSYLGHEGRQAFAWGESGCSVEEVQRALGELRAASHSESRRTPIIVVLLVLVIGIPMLVGAVGVMTALGIYGMRKYIVNAKQAEARSVAQELAGRIAQCANGRGGLPPSSRPVPASLASVRGMKYQSARSDWEDEAFVCAGFARTVPQYFQYQWVRKDERSGFVTAVGDLDGDGEPEQRLSVEVECDAGKCRVVSSAP